MAAHGHGPHPISRSIASGALRQAQHCATADLKRLNMAGGAVIKRLEVKVDCRIRRRKNPAVKNRMKADNNRVRPRQFKCDLDFLMYFGVVGIISNPVENMKIDEILATADQERERPLRVETGCR